MVQRYVSICPDDAPWRSSPRGGTPVAITVRVACIIRHSVLTLSGNSKAYGGRVLFADATLQANRQDRIGLVGPNGAGKSTLFSLILGEESADDGEVILERGVTFGHLPQESAPVGDESVVELATDITPEYTKLRRIIKAWDADHP
jgi:ATP-binding cassette subfamily F protein 3